MTSLLAVILSFATLSPGSLGHPDDPRILVAHRARQAISIDGVLNEQDWAVAPFATGFLQYEPTEGAAPSQRTEVRVLYSNNSIYIGAHLFDTEPDKIWRTLGRRDDKNKADWFFVSIDSYLNRKSAYTFGVNAAGVQRDGVTTREMNSSWDAVWDSAVRVTADGWIVEMRIPYSMLRFTEAENQSWGLNFKRLIPRTSETLEWALVKRSERDSGVVSKYGELHGLNRLRPRKNIQITPYTVSQILTEEGDPGERVSDGDYNFGADLKIGLSSNITLDMTVNPDFGQVEADPAELNLTAFETFFREKRPFFVEGAQTLNFSLDHGSSLLYSRRIGAADPIIGASKLSGRTEGGLQFGILGAATGSGFNPNRYFGVTRVKQELGKYSSIGGIVTLFNRDVAYDGLTSVVGGADWDIRLADNTYKISGLASVTNRQFEDPSFEDTRGFSAYSEFEKVKGSFTYSTSVRVVSEDFNPNDIGRIRDVDFLSFSTKVDLQFNDGQPFGPFRRASVFTYVYQSISYSEGLDRGLGNWLRAKFFTNGYQSIEFSLNSSYLLGGYDLNETRGLGAWRAPRKVKIGTKFETDSRRQWQVEPEIEYEVKERGGKRIKLGLESSWNAGSRLRLSAEVNLNRTRGDLAWATNQSFQKIGNEWMMAEEAGSPSNFSEEDYLSFNGSDQLESILESVSPHEDDAYYVPIFGRRDTDSMDFTLRSNITFSPNLSLQIYGQLFAAKGQYDNFTLLQNRDDLAAFDAYPKRHDFAFSSFQTNTVLRWEYRPGSTLFLVWTHSRRGSAEFDPFDLTARSPYRTGTLDQISEAFDVFPQNVFLIKLNYLFMR